MVMIHSSVFFFLGPAAATGQAVNSQRLQTVGISIAFTDENGGRIYVAQGCPVYGPTFGPEQRHAELLAPVLGDQRLRTLQTKEQKKGEARNKR